MLKLGENPLISEFDVTGGKLKGLISGRIALIFLLLLASWWWNSSYLELPEENFPAGLFLIFLLSLGLTSAYLFLVRFNRNYRTQVRVQFFIDVMLVTGIIWQTGDVVSPYVALYILLISVVGFFLGRNETLLLAVFSAACFSTLATLAAKLVISTTSSAISPARFMQIVAFNDVAILIVGLLAGRFSERRRVNEELRETIELFSDLHILHERIVESIRTGLITTDLDGKIYAFNRAAEEISGLPAGAVIGQSIFSIFGEGIRAKVDRCLHSVESDDFKTEHFETEFLSGTKKRTAIACTIAPLVGKTGSVTGLILNFQDLTQMRVMEETLRRSDRLAAVGRMAAGLAHEIRNPLGSMSSALQFLHEKVPPGTEEAELMQIVLRESDRLNKIITNFLTYARPSASVVFAQEKFDETDLGEAIRDCLMLLRHSPEVKEHHALEFEMPNAPVRVKANETQIKQVFWNLSKNSIQAMPDGGRLNIRVKEFPGKNVQIVFEDTGAGIGSESLEHLFEPFASGANGTGLGLSIVHKIITDHGGRIDVQSRQKHGTKIIVELPKGKEGF